MDELPSNILLMRILESMKSTPHSSLSQPLRATQTLPHPSQPPGKHEPIDGPPLTQAPPPPSLHAVSPSHSYIVSPSSMSELGVSSGGRLVSFAGGGTGISSYGGSMHSGSSLTGRGGGGGYGGSLRREGSNAQVRTNAAISNVSSLRNLSLNISTSPAVPSSQSVLTTTGSQQRQVLYSPCI